jgi:hypothetical protein
MIRNAAISPTAKSMIQDVCAPMSQRNLVSGSKLLYQHVLLTASHLRKSKVRNARLITSMRIRNMPEIARCVWRDSADEANEGGSSYIIFFHRPTVDVVHNHQSSYVSELKLYMCRWAHGTLSDMQKNSPAESIKLDCWRIKIRRRNAKARPRTLVRKDEREHRQSGYSARAVVVNETPKTKLAGSCVYLITIQKVHVLCDQSVCEQAETHPV